MTVHQMVCHLNDSFAVGTGKRRATPASNPLSRTLVKWIALGDRQYLGELWRDPIVRICRANWPSRA